MFGQIRGFEYEVSDNVSFYTHTHCAHILRNINRTEAACVVILNHNLHSQFAFQNEIIANRNG